MAHLHQQDEINMENAILNGISNRSWNTLKRRKIDNKYYIPTCTSTITSITKLIMIICEQHKQNFITCNKYNQCGGNNGMKLN